MKTQSKRLERFARSHSPVNDPPFTWWHLLLLLVVVGLYLAQQHVPGLLADPGRFVVASWEVGIFARLTAFFLACWTLFGVRAMSPAMLLVQVLQVVYLCSRISEIRITHEPFTATFVGLTVLLSVVSIRLITRPNEYELAQLVAQREGEEEDVQL